jgi:hypothetical protein
MSGRGRHVRRAAAGALIAFDRIDLLDAWCTGASSDADLCGRGGASADRGAWCGLGDAADDKCYPYNRIRRLGTWRDRYVGLRAKLYGRFVPGGAPEAPLAIDLGPSPEAGGGVVCVRTTCHGIRQLTLAGEWLEIHYRTADGERAQVFHFGGNAMVGRMPGAARDELVLLERVAER